MKSLFDKLAGRTRWFPCLFVYSAAAILVFTAAAKVVSAFGSAKVLDVRDPLLHCTFRQLFLHVSIVELLVAAACFSKLQLRLRIGLIAWLASLFVAYRISLALIGYKQPCACLGNLTEAAHISPQAYQLAMLGILFYLVAGSCFSILLLKLSGVEAARISSL